MEKKSRPELPDWPVVVFGPRQKIESLSKRGWTARNEPSCGCPSSFTSYFASRPAHLTRASSVSSLDPHTAAVLSFKADAKEFLALPTPGTMAFIHELQKQILREHWGSRGDLLVVTSTHVDLSIRDTLWVLNVPCHRSDPPYHWQWLVPKDLVQEAVPRPRFNYITEYVLSRIQGEGATSGRAVLELWGEIMNYAVEGDTEGIMAKVFPDVKETGGRSTLSNRSDLTHLLLKAPSTREYAPEIFQTLDGIEKSPNASQNNDPEHESGGKAPITYRLVLNKIGTVDTAMSLLGRLAKAEEQASARTNDGADDEMPPEEEAARRKQSKKQQRKREQRKRQQRARKEAKLAQQATSPLPLPGPEVADIAVAGSSSGEGTSEECHTVTPISAPISLELAAKTEVVEEANNPPTKAVIDASGQTPAMAKSLGDEASDEASDGEAPSKSNTGRDHVIHCSSPGVTHLAEGVAQVLDDGAEAAALDCLHENLQPSEDEDTESCAPVQEYPYGKEDQREDDPDSEPEDEVGSTSSRPSISAAGATKGAVAGGDEPEGTKHGLEEDLSLVDVTAQPLPPPTPVKKAELSPGRRPVPFKLPPIQPALPDLELLKRHIRRNQGFKSPERRDSVDANRIEQATETPETSVAGTCEGGQIKPATRQEYRFPIPLTAGSERTAYMRARTRSMDFRSHMSTAHRDDAPEHEDYDGLEDEGAQRRRSHSLPRRHRFRVWSEAKPYIRPLGMFEPPLRGLPYAEFATFWSVLGWYIYAYAKCQV